MEDICFLWQAVALRTEESAPNHARSRTAAPFLIVSQRKCSAAWHRWRIQQCWQLGAQWHLWGKKEMRLSCIKENICKLHLHICAAFSFFDSFFFFNFI